MSFNSLLIDHMKVVQVTVDTWSEPTDAVEDAIPCRIMYDTRLMKNFKGEEVLSFAKVFIRPEHITNVVHHEDQLQFDIEGYAKNHPIITIKQPQDSTHIHHAEIWVQ